MKPIVQRYFDLRREGLNPVHAWQLACMGF